MSEKLVGFMGRYGLVFGIFFVVMILGANISLLSSEGQSSEKMHEKTFAVAGRKEIPRLSDMEGPSIGGAGAAIVREENRDGKRDRSIVREEARGSILPIGVWIVILATYLFLLVFNLGFDFGKRSGPQWFWEASYTVLALASWFYWDKNQANVWFPLNVMAMGIWIYLFYLYFFWEKQKIESRIPERSK